MCLASREQQQQSLLLLIRKLHVFVFQLFYHVVRPGTSGISQLGVHRDHFPVSYFVINAHHQLSQEAGELWISSMVVDDDDSCCSFLSVCLLCLPVHGR